MSTVTYLYSPWQLAAEALDRIAELMNGIPGWDGYQAAPETQDELERATALFQQAIALLKQASERESIRYEEPGQSARS